MLWIFGYGSLIWRPDFDFVARRPARVYGWQRRDLELHFLDTDGGTAPGVVYLAPEGNHAYLGPARLTDIARQIVHSKGPSGRNVDYLIDLATALRAMNADDAHVFELEHAIREHL